MLPRSHQQEDVTMDIQEIISSLEVYDGRYKREAMDAAVEQRDEIIPHLLTILENVLAEPGRYAEDGSYQGHLHAAVLLAHFRESRAHKVLVDLCSLPDDMPYQIFGDMLNENFCGILCATCGGSLELIKALVTNKEADAYSRAAGMTAMVYSVMDGVASREEVLSFLGSLFTGYEAELGSDFWSFLVGDICDLYPMGLEDVLEDAYERGLVHSLFVTLSWVKEVLEEGLEPTLERTRKKMRYQMPEGVHDYLSWWAAFRQAERP